MQKIFLFIFAVTPMLLALGGFTVTQKEMASGKNKGPIEIELKGAEEVPGPGDPDGSGKAKITFNHDKGEICYDLSVKNIGEATLAHIHNGAAGQAGDVKVMFDPPKKGSSKGCTKVDHELIQDIMANPANYYVNVHNTEFPKGALRGQLGK